MSNEYRRLCDAKSSFLYTRNPPDFLDTFKKNNFSSIVDVGCGDGNLLFSLKSMNLLSNSKVFAADLSSTRINNLKKNIPDVHAFVSDATNLTNFQSNYFDFVNCSMLIEHVPDENALIYELKRIVKPHGIIRLTTIYKKWYGWYFYRNNNKWVIDPTHLREYTTTEDLFEKIRHADLKIESSTMNLSWFPIVDFFLHRCYNGKTNIIIDILRLIKIPIPGYYSWILYIKK